MTWSHINECHRANDLRVESQGQDEGQGQDQGQGQGQGHWGGVEPSSYNYYFVILKSFLIIFVADNAFSLWTAVAER